MKYCQVTTTSHRVATTYATCQSDLNQLIVSEGYDGAIPFFLNNEIVLDMDLAEALESATLGRIERLKSMDMAFGLTNADNSKRQMLMVELKLNMHDFYRLSRQNLEEKVHGSSLILSNLPPIYKRFIFVVRSKYLNEAISRLYRMIPKIDSNYVIYDLDALKGEYFT